MIRGRDVSHHNGTINWKTRRTVDRLSFGMAKCTEGTTFYDPQYVANLEGCHTAGMPFVPYHYAEPGSGSALTQVKRFIAKAGTVDGYCLDLEISTLGQADTNAWMRQFGDDLRALTDKPTFVYLGGYAANGSGQGSVNHFDHWIYPHYTRTSWPTVYAPQVGGNTTGWHVPPAPSMWQCSDDIGGLDADVSNLSVAQLFSTGPTPAPKPVPIEGSDMFGISLQESGKPDVGYVSDIMGCRQVTAAAWKKLVDAHCISGSPIVVTTVAELEDVAGPIQTPTP